MTQELQNISMKALRFESMNDYASVRALAISAGELSIAIRNEVKKILQENHHSISRSLDSGLKELVSRELISSQECENLDGICKHLLNAIRGKEAGEQAYLAIKSTYHRMLIDPSTSPAALSIASVAHSAFDIEDSGSGSPEKTMAQVVITPMSTGAGAAIGAIIGGVIGGLAGGGLGAGLGAAIGGAAGAAIGWCNENGK